MSLPPTDLETLRRDIDAIDDRIQDLLVQRAAIVANVAAAKKAGSGVRFLRAGREASILRRLVARHTGALPPAALARIYRELIGGLYRLQAPLKVAVLAPERSVGYWDLARNHFGSTTEMTLHRTASVVLRAITGPGNAVGVLPLPPADEPEPWWDTIAAESGPAPRVIARLPIINDPTGRFENLESYIVGLADPEPSGDDTSLVVVTIAPEVSRATFNAKLAKAGLDGRIIAAREERIGTHLLIQVADFVAENDPRLVALVAAAPGSIQRAVRIGAFANLIVNPSP